MELVKNSVESREKLGFKHKHIFEGFAMTLVDRLDSVAKRVLLPVIIPRLGWNSDALPLVYMFPASDAVWRRTQNSKGL